MANPQKPTTSNTIHDATSSIRDAARERLKRVDTDEMLERAEEGAQQYYEQALDWANENRRILFLTGGVLVIGLLGYFIGRRSGSSSDFNRY